MKQYWLRCGVCDRVLEKYRIQLFPNRGSVENFNAANLVFNNVQNDRAFVRCQHHIPMVWSVSPVWLRLRIERGAEIVSTGAPFQNLQARHLSRYFHADAGTGTSSAGTSVFTETWGQVRPLKFNRTVCVY